MQFAIWAVSWGAPRRGLPDNPRYLPPGRYVRDVRDGDVLVLCSADAPLNLTVVPGRHPDDDGAWLGTSNERGENDPEYALVRGASAGAGGLVGSVVVDMRGRWATLRSPAAGDRYLLVDELARARDFERLESTGRRGGASSSARGDRNLMGLRFRERRRARRSACWGVEHLGEGDRAIVILRNRETPELCLRAVGPHQDQIRRRGGGARRLSPRGARVADGDARAAPGVGAVHRRGAGRRAGETRRHSPRTLSQVAGAGSRATPRGHARRGTIPRRPHRRGGRPAGSGEGRERGAVQRGVRGDEGEREGGEREGARAARSGLESTTTTTTTTRKKRRARRPNRTTPPRIGRNTAVRTVHPLDGPNRLPPPRRPRVGA